MNNYFFKTKTQTVIESSIKNYLAFLLKQQTVSIGKPDKIIYVENSLNVYNDKHNIMELNLLSFIKNGQVCVEIYLNGVLYECNINPKFFHKHNIKNYLKEIEIEIKNKFNSIRKQII